jgi:hypothetical protein
MIDLVSLLLAVSTPISPTPSSGNDWHVHVSIDVGSDGHAAGCHILDSNAPVEMQTKTCQIFQEKGKFTPKRDSEGRAVPSTYETVVRYRIPGNNPGQVPTQTANFESSDPLLRPIHVGDWDGTCRKANAADAHFVECDAQFVKPNMTGSITRTYKGIEITIRSHDCGTDEPVGRAKVPKNLLSPPWDASAFGGSLGGAIVAAKQQCPAMTTHVNVAGEIKDLLAATGDLQR